MRAKILQNGELTEPVSGRRVALLLLFLFFSLSIGDRMILSVLFEPIKMLCLNLVGMSAGPCWSA